MMPLKRKFDALYFNSVNIYIYKKFKYLRKSFWFDAIKKIKKPFEAFLPPHPTWSRLHSSKDGQNVSKT
jgi:hypothetical protein